MLAASYLFEAEMFLNNFNVVQRNTTANNISIAGYSVTSGSAVYLLAQDPPLNSLEGYVRECRSAYSDCSRHVNSGKNPCSSCVVDCARIRDNCAARCYNRYGSGDGTTPPSEPSLD